MYVKGFIEFNFGTFVREYNKAHPNDSFEATGIEYWALIPGKDNKNARYLYLDFDGDNGYFVGTGEFMIYGFATKGDLPELRDNSNVWYAPEGMEYGFFYKDENGKFQLYDIYTN